MGLQDVAFLPFQTSCYTTFLMNCGKGEILTTATYVRDLIVGKQGHAPCKILLLQCSPFFVPVKFHRDCWIVTKLS